MRAEIAREAITAALSNKKDSVRVVVENGRGRYASTGFFPWINHRQFS